MDPSERNMVLSNWKKEMFATLVRSPWGYAMRHVDYWSLVNHVLDRITLPSSKVFVGEHADVPGTPMCWAATRDGELLYTYEKKGLARHMKFTPEDVLLLRNEFLRLIPVVAIKSRDFNPFMELDRQ